MKSDRALAESIIVARSGRSAQELAARREARRILKENRIKAPPTDLRRIALAMGVDVECVALHGRARLVTRGGRLVAQVNESLSGYSAEFALAHELGHVLLGVEGTSRHGGNVREHLCDVVGRELIVSEEWLLALDIGGRGGIVAATELARTCQVPTGIIVERLAHTITLGCGALWARRRGEEVCPTRLIMVGSSGLRNEIPAYQLPWLTSWRVTDGPFRDCDRSGSYGIGELSITVDGDECSRSYAVEVCPDERDGFVGLILPSRGPRT